MIAVLCSGAAFDMINTLKCWKAFRRNASVLLTILQKIDQQYDVFSDIRGIGLLIRTRA
ncbi:hypothetical protein ACLB1S_27925 [Escherichia coli]